jgi:hypothetical protein
LVELLAVVSTYLSVLLPGAQSLIVIRALRLLRVFRAMKLVHFVGEARMLGAALHASSRKVIVFLGTVLTLVLIVVMAPSSLRLNRRSVLTQCSSRQSQTALTDTCPPSVHSESSPQMLNTRHWCVPSYPALC